MSFFTSFFSPAKLNLFFKVISKRSDGYHEIASLYQTISLGDIIRIRLADKDSFLCINADLSNDSSNLIIKALQLFRKKAVQRLFFADIIIEKNIPMMAGLGGGSSNAATILWALNELLERPLTLEELILLGAQIGSDVAFFLSSGTALCKGRGEVFKNISPIKMKAIVAKPSFGLSTKEVYSNVKINKAIDHVDYTKISKETKYKFFNDLEDAAFSLKPQLKQIQKQLLKMGFDQVIMTGSGTSFFCLGETKIKNIDGIQFYPVESIQRNYDSWYLFYKCKKY